MPKTALKPLSEELLACPQCGRENFTKRGLRAHVCRPATATVVVVDAAKPVDLANLDGQLCTAVHNLQFLGDRARQELDAIDRAERCLAARAVLFGCVLVQIRAGLEYGQFGAFMQEHFPVAKRRQCYYYIALAEKFVRSQKLMLPELTALPQMTLELVAPNQLAAAAFAKVETFVGTRSLNDLLQRHGIKKVGGHREKSGAAGPAVEVTPAQAAAAAFENGYNRIKECEEVLLGGLVWCDITLDLALELDAKLKACYGRFHEKLLELRHAASANLRAL